MSTDERDDLLSYLDAQREVLHRAAFGLTDEQAAAAPSASELSVGGLIKHLATVEFSWVHATMAGRDHPYRPTEENWAENFRLGDDTLALWQERYRQVARETEEYVRSLPDLEEMHPLAEAPWLPKGPRSTRWILLTVIQETARHAGHADIVRESLDGATAFELVARASGTEMPWVRSATTD